MSNSQDLGTSFIDGLKTPNYFNGRMLAAEDLQFDQTADRTRESWLGQAAGYGVITGLVVTQAGTTSVTVQAGLGLNRLGQLLQLPDDLILPVLPQAPDQGPGADLASFTNCNVSTPQSAGALPRGAYLLTALPTSRLEGQAPMKAAGGTGSPGCASKWETAGLQFKLIRLTGFQDTGSGVTAQNRQDLLAHWCFGSVALDGLAQDPFTFGEDFTGLDSVAAADLTPADLPLAALYWNGSAIDFVDMWAARRRLIRPYALDSWTGLLSDKRVALGQARFLQFQAQLAGLANQAHQIRAADTFPLLPPCGFLPLAAERFLRELEQPSPGTVAAGRAQRTQMAGARLAAVAAQERAAAANATLTVDPTIRQMTRQMSALRVELAALRRSVAQPAAPAPAGAVAGNPAPAGGIQLATAIRTPEFARLVSFLNASADPRSGFDLFTFFEGFSIRIGLIDRETVDFTLNRSWYDEALDANPPNERRPAVDIHIVLDTLRDTGGSLYAMFTKPLRPIRWIYPPRRQRVAKARNAPAAGQGTPTGGPPGGGQ